MEAIMGVLLGHLGLFYPTLIAAAVCFIVSLIKRSWKWMLASTILIYPGTWYLGAMPPFFWAGYIPLIPLALTIWLFLLTRKERGEVKG